MRRLAVTYAYNSKEGYLQHSPNSLHGTISFLLCCNANVLDEPWAYALLLGVGTAVLWYRFLTTRAFVTMSITYHGYLNISKWGI
ncbi:predicted protein [Lichtheimia corymbifera JMRC:FSU:9682]|uniref:Uncharacterized protein n=1 Tax=Lichtheimia corymbifera JMRC:FSU:9682 TaxID=1263082 RepID=A0A068RXJ4_9FUNG|nr:predicted protein [Lichtheimia corymbifera JMRC:FSU:9682]